MDGITYFLGKAFNSFHGTFAITWPLPSTNLIFARWISALTFSLWQTAGTDHFPEACKLRKYKCSATEILGES
jgi:hypothetical protein